MSAAAKDVYRFLVEAVSVMAKKNESLNNKINDLDLFTLDCTREEERLAIMLRKHLLADDIAPSDYYEYLDGVLGFGCHNLRDIVQYAQGVIASQSKKRLDEPKVLVLKKEHELLTQRLSDNKHQSIYKTRFTLEQRVAGLAKMVLAKRDDVDIAHLYRLAKKWKITRIFLSQSERELTPLADLFTMYHGKLVRESHNPTTFYTPEDDLRPPLEYRIAKSDALTDIVAKMDKKTALFRQLDEEHAALTDALKAVKKQLTEHAQATKDIEEATLAMKPHKLWPYLEKDLQIANGYQKAFVAAGLDEHANKFMELQTKKALYAQSAKGLKLFATNIKSSLIEYKMAKERLRSYSNSHRRIDSIKLSSLKKDLASLISSSEKVLSATASLPRTIERSYQQYRYKHQHFDMTLMLPIFIAASNEPDTQTGLAVMMQEGGLAINAISSVTLPDISASSSIASNISAAVSDISSSTDASTFSSDIGGSVSSVSVTVDCGSF